MARDPSPMPPATEAAPWLPPTPGAPTHLGAGGDVALTEAAAPAKRSRAPWVIALAAAAVVVVGLGAVFALRGGGANDVTVVDAAVELPAAESFSLSAAAAQAAESTAVEYDLTMSAGALGSIDVAGGIDEAAQLMIVRMDMGSLLGGVTGGEVDLILDIGNQVMYMGADGLGGFLPTSEEWIALDFGVLAAESGQSVDDFTDSFGANPLDAAKLFDAAAPGDIVEVGDDEIDGTPTKHYQVTIDMAAVLGSNPQLDGEIDIGFGDLPDDVVYDVWVTEDNQLRRIEFSFDAAGESIDMVINMRSVGGSLGIEVPDAADVFDVSDLLGG